MRTIALMLTATLLSLLVVGCQAERALPIPDPGNISEFSDLNGLVLSVGYPWSKYSTGDRVPLRIAVANTTKGDIDINSPDDSLVYVSLVQKTHFGTRIVKRFPGASMQVLTPWVLPAGEDRTFNMSLPVTPDWPTNEQLILRVELNGITGLQTDIPIRIVPPRPPPNQPRR